MMKLENVLISKEKKYGGRITNVPRNKVSHLDPRSKKAIKTGGMTGGDRMLHHGYAKKYAEYLSRVLKEGASNVVLIEVGILRGSGVAMWCDIFNDGRIIGLDIDLGHIHGNMKNLKKAGAFKKCNPELYEFDQFLDNKKYLKKLLKKDKINICIDDGVHTDEAILSTMKSVVPNLSKDFTYFIEDNTQVHKKIRKRYPDFYVENEGELTIISSGQFKKRTVAECIKKLKNLLTKCLL